MEYVNITRDQYEIAILSAFAAGMNAGYGIEHTEIREEEDAAIREYAKKKGFKRTALN